nr:PHB depolymerase family esterase [Kibdelosporangium sp. MJ126-NF4]CEL18556.1 esterase, PHB depolymerase family [Kibdelosporangium sp. MJ126-NF4]CTQ98040.1 esterase, PHB depolymerase family [Kibdelosporangium sp. MJ126-NF4]
MRLRTAAAALLMAAGLLPVMVSPASAAGRDIRGSFANQAGLVEYQVHLPPSYRPDRPMPVLLAIHGCRMTGYTFNSMQDTSRFSEIADREGFIVVYPTQSPLRNLLGCWNFQKPENQVRGQGEPSLLTGMVNKVVHEFDADRRRVHVIGASSGAAMTSILAVTYPDMFASAAIFAGCEYACDQVLAAGPENISPVVTAQKAYAQMGTRARQVPVSVVQGDADPTVPPIFAARLVTHFAALDDLVTDGTIDGDVDDVPDTTARVVNDGDRPYVKTTYSARDGGTPLIEKYLIEGLAHRWPKGGKADFVDPLGPDISSLLWKTFFATHSLP